MAMSVGKNPYFKNDKKTLVLKKKKKNQFKIL